MVNLLTKAYTDNDDMDMEYEDDKIALMYWRLQSKWVQTEHIVKATLMTTPIVKT